MSELLAVVRFDVSIVFDEVCAVIVLNKNCVHVPGYCWVSRKQFVLESSRQGSYRSRFV